jgi:lipoyl(octanoyl) transferase
MKYQKGLALQQAAFEEVKEGRYEGILMVLEHSPVYTIGADGGWDNLLKTREFFDSQGIDIVKINRGGNVTFHGPGQIVAYPIFDLKCLKKDIHWFMDCLENSVINVLKQYGVEGSQKPQYRGTWVGDKKISAVGVHVRKWIATHGLSFNINLNKEYFNWINPCGITEFGITSLEDYTDQIDIALVKEQLIRSFEDIFQIKLEEAGEGFLEIKE